VAGSHRVALGLSPPPAAPTPMHENRFGHWSNLAVRTDFLLRAVASRLEGSEQWDPDRDAEFVERRTHHIVSVTSAALSCP
jgi:hypothetical protein